jgi:hypothetical protein
LTKFTAGTLSSGSFFLSIGTPFLGNVLFSIWFGFTAINCPRSLQIPHCQRMLFCTLQRIYSSVAIFSDYLIKKSLQFWRGLGCNMQTSNFRLCKRICCDCKTLIAHFEKIRRLLQFWVLTTIQLLLQNSLSGV